MSEVLFLAGSFQSDGWDLESDYEFEGRKVDLFAQKKILGAKYMFLAKSVKEANYDTVNNWVEHYNVLQNSLKGGLLKNPSWFWLCLFAESVTPEVLVKVKLDQKPNFRKGGGFFWIVDEGRTEIYGNKKSPPVIPVVKNNLTIETHIMNYLIRK